MPGVLFAVIIGTLAYYALGYWSVAGMHIARRPCPVRLALPRLDAGILHGFAGVIDTLP
jgi:hypothetical protein